VTHVQGHTVKYSNSNNSAADCLHFVQMWRRVSTRDRRYTGESQKSRWQSQRLRSQLYQQ